MSSRGASLPNLIVAGAPKCGTSSVHDWLARHPDASGSNPKETAYFCDAGSHIHDPKHHIANGMEGYRRFFPQGGAKVVFESTPAYIYHHTALERLPELESQPRFLFILREPSAQLYSLYRYSRDNWNWVPADMSFAAFIEAARTGHHGFGGNELCTRALANAAYVDALAKWEARVGQDRMKVMLFDDLVRDPRLFMRDLCSWLGIDGAFYDDFVFASANETYAVKWRGLQAFNVAVRKLLVPLGPLYTALRSAYRALNTAPPDGPSEKDREVMRVLRHEFQPANVRLAQAFSLNLSGWR